MIEIGKIQKLKISREVPFGVYLTEDGKTAAKAGSAKPAVSGGRIDTSDIEEVLLPGAQVPEGAAVSDEIEVFIYRDSKDRPVATVNRPKLTLGEVGRLHVVSVTRIGAFLDWGLERDLFLPYHEQRGNKLNPGDEVLVAVYLDKSSRLCATMNVYHYLRTDSPYLAGASVTGTVYETSGNFGTFVAVDDIYSALIPKQELVKTLVPGECVTARITKVRDDGKLSLSLREKAYLQMDMDADTLADEIEKRGGRLGFTDKAEPELIRKELAMSKNEFKRAVGRLLKQERIRILEDSIVLEEEPAENYE